MSKNKLLFSSLILALTVLPSFAADVSLSDIEIPKPPAYRVGLSETPENQYVQAVQDRMNLEKKYAQLDSSKDDKITDMTYADLSIKRLSKEISQELEFEEQDMLSDLSLLWQGAAMQSDTINFALYKLANPDADKPDEKSIKKVLSTIASMSTLVGASMGNPLLAGSSLIGGNVLGIMSQDTKALNYKYTRVNDADMIILIRKVEDLQQKAVDLYYDYISAKKQLEFVNDLVKECQRKFELVQKNDAQRELVVITDAYYRTSLDKQRAAKSEFFSKRAALEQFVGNETFLQFESELVARENGEVPKMLPANDEEAKEQNEEYMNTVQNVENFNKTLQEKQHEETSEAEEFSVNESRVDVNLESSFDSEMSDAVTGFSSSIDEEENVEASETQKDNKKQRNKKQKVKKVVRTEKIKSETQNVKKYPKNSTKNLIFLHGADKHSVVKPYSQVEEKTQSGITSPVDMYIPQKKQIQDVDTLGLPPLDEIKVPELTRGGYSIHSEYYGE